MLPTTLRRIDVDAFIHATKHKISKLCLNLTNSLLAETESSPSTISFKCAQRSMLLTYWLGLLSEDHL